MKVICTIPVIFDLVNRRSKTARYGIAAMEAEVSVREPAADATPDAYFVTTMGRPNIGMSWKVHDGLFYNCFHVRTRTDPWDVPNAIRNRVETALWTRARLRIESMQSSELLPQKARTFATSFKKPFPKDMLQQLKAHFLDAALDIGRDDGFPGGAAEWAALAQTAADGMVIADARVYTRRGDPCVSVRRPTRGIILDGIHLSTTEDHASVVSAWKSEMEPDRHEFISATFPLHRAAEAQDFCDSLGIVTSPENRLDRRIEVLCDGIPTPELDYLELDRFSRLLSIDVDVAVTRMFRTRSMLRREEYRDVMLSVMALDDILRTSDPFTAPSDDLPDRLETLLDAVAEHRAQGTEFSARVSIDDVRASLAAWHERPIVVPDLTSVFSV